MPVLSVIMPAYNEAGSIVEAVGEVLAHVCAVVPDSEIVVVDDGSTDDTRALVERLAAGEPRLRLVTQANAGHGPAVLRGLYEARGDILLLLDSDRQVRLDDFGTHWALMRDEDLVALLGVRRPRQDPRHRLVISRLMRLLIATVFGDAPEDGGVPYKILRRSAWDEVSPLLPPDSWIPSVLAAVILKRRHGRRVREVVVRHVARDAGVSVLNYRRLARLCRHAAIETVQLRRALRRADTARVAERAGAGIV